MRVCLASGVLGTLLLGAAVPAQAQGVGSLSTAFFITVNVPKFPCSDVTFCSGGTITNGSADGIISVTGTAIVGTAVAVFTGASVTGSFLYRETFGCPEGIAQGDVHISVSGTNNITGIASNGQLVTSIDVWTSFEWKRAGTAGVLTFNDNPANPTQMSVTAGSLTLNVDGSTRVTGGGTATFVTTPAIPAACVPGSTATPGPITASVTGSGSVETLGSSFGLIALPA